MNVPLEKQQQPNWCWAACLRMAAGAFGRPAPSQGTLASQFLHVSGCDAQTTPVACNQGLPSGTVGALFRAVGLAALSMPPTELAIRQVLDRDLGLVLLLLALQNGQHYTLVTGLAPANKLTMADPIFGTFLALFADLNTGYHLGGAIEGSWRIASSGQSASPL